MERRPFIVNSTKIAQYVTPLNLVWKPKAIKKAYSEPPKTLIQMHVKKIRSENPPGVMKPSPDESNSSGRMRYKMGMQVSAPFLARLGRKEEGGSYRRADSPQSSIFSNATFTEDIEENVLISPISHFELPRNVPKTPALPPLPVEAFINHSSSSVMHPKLRSKSSAVAARQFKIKSQEFRLNQKRLSSKNPHRSSDNFNFRSTIKQFIAPSIAAERNPLSFELGPPKVLLVEDSPSFRDSLKQKLTQICSWEPDVASNGAEAVQMFKNYAALNYRYTAIYMDTTMPVMDGYAATKAIRALEISEGMSRTTIVGLVGNFEPDSKVRCIEVGMSFAGNA
jgi:CheY-like chemotaxis protein